MNNENKILNLPQLEVRSSILNTTEEILMVTGGRKPNKHWLIKSIKNRRLWCIDHGVDVCRENNLIPDLLLGDFDSAQSDSLDWAVDNAVKIERHPIDKDWTDTQLALNRAAETENLFLIVTGVFGGRFDHLYSTIFSCANAKVKNCLADEREVVLFLKGKEQMELNFNVKPIALSLLPITEICHGVTIDGVHWKLEAAELRQSQANAVSNRVESNKVKISMNEGILAVYLCFDETKLN